MKQALLLMTMVFMAAAVQAQALRDPTQPPASVASPQSADAYGISGELHLEAIRQQPGKKPVALINGQLCKVGDEVAGRKVLRIGDSDVLLGNGAEKETLRLSPAVEKIMKTNRSSRPATRPGAGGGA